MSELVAVFVFFFAVIDPIGTVPVFVAVTRHLDDRGRRAVALRAVLMSALILVFFVVAGELILTAMNIPIDAFQIAGGIILFLFALTMIFGESKPEEELKLVDRDMQMAIFPLAVPSIASPGAMLGAVLMTENSRYNLLEQAITGAVMLSVLLLVLLLLLVAGRIHRLVGDAGASVISRVMGFILASVAVTQTLQGLGSWFALGG